MSGSPEGGAQGDRTRQRSAFAGIGVMVSTAVSESVVRTVLPLAMIAAGIDSLFVIGLVLAAWQGVGVIVAIPISARADHTGNARAIVLAGLLTLAAGVALTLVTTSPLVLLWLLPAVVLGVGRSAGAFSALAQISRAIDPTRIQGFNGTAQRGAAAAAAILSVWLLANELWIWSFVIVALLGLLMVPLGHVMRASRPLDPVAPPFFAALPEATRLVRREPALRASAFVGIASVTVATVGGSFLPVSLGVGFADAAVWLVVFLLVRDAAGMLLGPWFARFVRLVGFRRIILLIGLTGAAGTLLLGVPSFPVLILSAVLQGAALILSLGCGNMLAANFSTGAGPALSIAATNIPIAAASILLPIALGAAYDTAGIGLVWGIGAAVVAAGALLAHGQTGFIRAGSSPAATAPVPRAS